MMNLEEIKNILPHRYPFLLVDRVLEVRDGEYCKALKNVSGILQNIAMLRIPQVMHRRRSTQVMTNEKLSRYGQ